MALSFPAISILFPQIVIISLASLTIMIIIHLYNSILTKFYLYILSLLYQQLIFTIYVLCLLMRIFLLKLLVKLNENINLFLSRKVLVYLTFTSNLFLSLPNTLGVCYSI